jgi:hypothetical protein
MIFSVHFFFFSTKTTDPVVTSGSHFLRNHKKKGSLPYFWHKNLTRIFKKAIKNRVISIKKMEVSIDKMSLKTSYESHTFFS